MLTLYTMQNCIVYNAMHGTPYKTLIGYMGCRACSDWLDCLMLCLGKLINTGALSMLVRQLTSTVGAKIQSDREKQAVEYVHFGSLQISYYNNK